MADGIESMHNNVQDEFAGVRGSIPGTDKANWAIRLAVDRGIIRFGWRLGRSAGKHYY